MSYHTTTFPVPNIPNDPTVPVYSASGLWTGLAILLVIWLAKDYRLDWRDTLRRSPQRWSNYQSTQASLRVPWWVYIPLAPFAGVYLVGRLLWELFRIVVFAILDGVIFTAHALAHYFYHTVVPLTIWIYQVGLGQILRLWLMELVERSAIWLYDVGFPTLARACTTTWQASQRTLTNTRNQLVYVLYKLFRISYALYHYVILPLVYACQILGRGLLYVGHHILFLVRILIYCSRIMGLTLTHDLVGLYTYLLRTSQCLLRAIHHVIYHMGLATLGQRVFHRAVLIRHYLAKVQVRVLVEISIGYQHWVIPTLRVVKISLLCLSSTMGQGLRYTGICVRQISKIWFAVLHHYGLQGWWWMTHWSESVKHWVSHYHYIWISLQQWCHRGQVLVLQGWLTYQSSCLWVVQRVLGPIAHKVLVPGLTWLGHLLHQGVAHLGSFDVRLARNMQWVLSRLSLGVQYVCILLAIAVPYGRQLLQIFVMIENRLVVVLVAMWKRAFLPLLVHGGHSISTFLITLAQGIWTVSCIIWSMVEPSVPVFQQHISQAVDEVTLRIGHGILGWAKNLQYQQHDSE